MPLSAVSFSKQRHYLDASPSHRRLLHPLDRSSEYLISPGWVYACTVLIFLFMILFRFFSIGLLNPLFWHFGRRTLDGFRKREWVLQIVNICCHDAWMHVCDACSVV